MWLSLVFVNGEGYGSHPCLSDQVRLKPDTTNSHRHEYADGDVDLGPWGTILAVPMLVIVKSVADHVESLKPVSRLMSP